uniref:Zinc finger protein 283 n=1 Tax=Rhinolophus ferrumequinum TaxID=59479 RepID=A0A671G4R7_RHIFE
MFKSCSGFSGLCASPVEEPHGALINSCNSRAMTNIWSQHMRPKIHVQERTFLK